MNNLTLNFRNQIITFLLLYIYFILYFFKLLCYSKITFNWIVKFNTDIWPFYFFKILTKPYFLFFSKLFPTIRYNNILYDISPYIALEFLNRIIIIYCYYLKKKIYI